MKHNLARFAFPGSYFWRNTNQNEVDYIEETASDLKAYEFKWNPKKKRITSPIAFARNYPHASFQTVTPENFESFLRND